MASSVNESIVPELNDTTVLTTAEAVKNVTERIPATPEGMAVAYGSLVIMAMLPIFFGAFRSVRYHREQKVCIANLI